MTRLANWEKLLAAHFAAAAAKRFAWGTFDCALAACDGIHAITGIDPGAEHRGKYTTQAQAKAIVGPDLGAFAAGICKTNDFAEWPSAAFARRGDVAFIKASDPSGALGTVDLTGHFAWCASERGFIRVPMKLWLRAWRVG